MNTQVVYAIATDNFLHECIYIYTHRRSIFVNTAITMLHVAM